MDGQHTWKPSGDLLYNILTWLPHEHLDGRAPNSCDVSRQFDLTIEQAEVCRVELERRGEL